MMRYTTSIEDAVDRFYDEGGSTVELVPLRHGHWILEPPDYKQTWTNNWRCSVCGFASFVTQWFRYCPECGAKMDEEVKG